MTTPSNGNSGWDESWRAQPSSSADDDGWGPPAAPVAPGYGPAVAPAYGPPATPGYGPTYGQTYGPPPGVGGGQFGPPTAAGQIPRGAYRPPAHQPGIIPLRPIGLGEILDGAFRAIRYNPRAMFGLSAVVVAAAGVIEAALIWGASSYWGGDWLNADTIQSGGVSLGSFAGIIVTFVTDLIVFGITTTLLIGLLVIPVSRSVLGTRMTPGEIWQHAKPQLWRLLVVTFVVGIMVVVGGALWIGGMIWAGVTHNYAALAIIALVGGLGTLAWTAWMSVRTLLATPVLMLERLHVVESVRRSFRLSRGSFWRLLGIYLLASILVSVVAQVVGVPISGIASFVLVRTIGESAAFVITSALTSVIAALITTPFSAAVVALLYIDTRMRREGLDVQLVRSVQEQAA